MNQKHLRFTVARIPGETVSNHRYRQSLLNVTKPTVQHVPHKKLFADLLKREARRVMTDVTEAPANTIPVHLARLDFLRQLIGHSITHELICGAETQLSGRQLLYAHTVADFLAALEITRREHRAPAFLNNRDAEIAEINRKLDTLAGLFAQSRALNAVLDESIAADESEAVA